MYTYSKTCLIYLMMFSTASLKCDVESEFEEKIITIAKLMAQDGPIIITYTAPLDYNNTSGIIGKLSNLDVQVTVLDCKQTLSYLKDHISAELVKGRFNVRQTLFRVIIFGGTNRTADLLHDVEILDQQLGLGLVIRHFSMWFWIYEGGVVLQLNININNMAVIVLDHGKKHVKIRTLLWKVQGRRWQDVTTVRNVYSVFPNLRCGLNGHVLKASVLEWPPYIIGTGNADRPYTGLSIEIMDLLAEKFNFSYKAIVPDDRAWGALQADGNWSGIMGMMHQKTADVGLIPYVYTNERSSAMSLSFTFNQNIGVVVYKNPELDTKWKWKLFPSVFRWHVYVCGIVTLLAVTCFIVFIERCSYETQMTQTKASIPDLLQLGISVSLQRSSTYIPESSSGRVLFCSWFLFCMIVTSVYTGNLTALLTVDKKTVPFSSLEELAANEDFDVGAGEGSFFQSSLKDSNNTVFKRLWEKVKRSLPTSPIEAEIERNLLYDKLRRGHFAMMTTYPDVENTVNYMCKMTTMKEPVLSAYSSFTFPVNSPLSRLFYTDLQVVYESGILRQKMDEWLRKKSEQCFSNIPDKTVTLSMNEFFPAVVICFAMCSASCCVLMLEIIYLRHVINKKVDNSTRN